MTISEMIEMLEDIKSNHGDIDVLIPGEDDGAFDADGFALCESDEGKVEKVMILDFASLDSVDGETIQ